MRNALERTLPTLTVLLAVLVSGCAVPSAAEQVPAAPPSFKDASVHDPSVIKVGDTYYVFGSHLAAAKTTDFMQWDLVAEWRQPAATRCSTMSSTELQETFAWAQTHDAVGGGCDPAARRALLHVLQRLQRRLPALRAWRRRRRQRGRPLRRSGHCAEVGHVGPAQRRRHHLRRARPSQRRRSRRVLRPGRARCGWCTARIRAASSS